MEKKYRNALTDTLIHREKYPFMLKKKSQRLKKRKINKDENHDSSNCFQCDLVSYWLQTGQHKGPPTALPGDLSFTHQTPFLWPFRIQNILPVQKHHCFLAQSIEGQGFRKWYDTGGKQTQKQNPEILSNMHLCPQKTCTSRHHMAFPGTHDCLLRTKTVYQ
jgi:hypothetical protein